MNLEQLRISAQLHIGVAMEKPFARRYANECITQLCNLYPYTVMKRRKETLENVARDTPVDLPADCYMLYKVKSHGDKYQDFEVFGNEITFADGGTFELEYFKRPDPVNAESDVPEIPEPFHPSISLFMGAREKFRLFGEEDVDSIRLMREFAETSMLANDMRAKHGRRRIIQAPEWR